MDHLDPNIKLEVMGHEHQHRNIHQGHNAVANDFFGEVFEWTNWDSVKCQIRHVIGGGSDPWAAVELIFTGNSLKGESVVVDEISYLTLSSPGKPLNHEFVSIVHFNEAGKIDELRAYFDSDHISSHTDHHRN